MQNALYVRGKVHRLYKLCNVNKVYVEIARNFLLQITE